MSEELSNLQLVIGLVVTFSLIFGMIFMLGYYDYRVDRGKQLACENEFGPNAEWVGLTSDLGGVICETPDGELRSLDTLGEPSGSFGSYLNSLIGGVPT